MRVTDEEGGLRSATVTITAIACKLVDFGIEVGPDYSDFDQPQDKELPIRAVVQQQLHSKPSTA